MTKCPRLSLNRPRHRRSRWVGAAIVIVGVHLSGVAIGMMKWEDPAEPPAMPPAVMIDMLPPAPPPPPQKQPEPEIDIPDAEIPPEPELSEFLPPPPPEVEPVVQMAPKVEKKKEETKRVVEKKKEQKKETKKEKKKEEKKVEKKPVEQAEVPPPSHDKVFKTATNAPSPTMQEVPEPSQQAAAAGGSPAAASSGANLALAAAAKANWEGAMRALIEKHKKYPRSAQRRNQEGMPYVSVKIDRAGNLLDVRLTRSSGFDSLDEAAVEAFHRAAPLPPLPPEMDVAVHSFTLPLNFHLTED